MQGSKFSQGKKFPTMDDFGKKLWRITARWAGQTGEMNPKEVLARKLNMTEKTLTARFSNWLSWSLWELKQTYLVTQDADVLALVAEYLKEQ